MIYDGFVLWILFAFNDYPLENRFCTPALNPLTCLHSSVAQIDILPLWGYTGALYKDYF